MQRTGYTFLSLILLSSFAACDRRILTIDDSVPPAFRIEVSYFAHVDYFDWLEVYEVGTAGSRSENIGKDTHYQLMWKLFAQKIEARYPAKWKFRAIVYGEVPQGFKQEIPETGRPPILVEGRTYEVNVLAKWNGYPKPIRFTIQNGRAVPLSQ
jgi:hypothetical protein